MTRVLVIALVALSMGCDPVHDQSVEALGGEAQGVPKGPLHRPGQPCLVCHGGRGPGDPTFGVAGTLYAQRTLGTPLRGGVVEITDALGETRRFGTNEAGNFYVTATEWSPTYPLRVAVAQGETRIEMKTRVGGDGSCAGCHRDPAARDSVGHVFLVDDLAGAP